MSDTGKKYTGTRTGDTTEVLVNGKPLPPHPELFEHASVFEGFDWGYHGRKTNQLAMAILADFLDTKAAPEYCGGFSEMIAHLKGDSWEIKGMKINEFLRHLQLPLQNA